jgi:predicted RNase H-like HicB family nuclease
MGHMADSLVVAVVRGNNDAIEWLKFASFLVFGCVAMTTTYSAVVQKHDDWWIGWIEEIPGVNSQATTREGLLENLQDALEEALAMNRADARAAATGAFEEVSIPS